MGRWRLRDRGEKQRGDGERSVERKRWKGWNEEMKRERETVRMKEGGEERRRRKVNLREMRSKLFFSSGLCFT